MAKAKKPLPKGPKGLEVRDKSGRFAKGHCGGPGNPMGRKVAMLRRVLFEATTQADVRAVIKAMAAAAKKGDVAAAKVFLSYAVGQPGVLEPVEVEGGKVETQYTDEQKLMIARAYVAQLERGLAKKVIDMEDE